jgi:hypothetical protein
MHRHNTLQWYSAQQSFTDEKGNGSRNIQNHRTYKCADNKETLHFGKGQGIVVFSLIDFESLLKSGYVSISFLHRRKIDFEWFRLFFFSPYTTHPDILRSKHKPSYANVFLGS